MSESYKVKDFVKELDQLQCNPLGLGDPICIVSNQKTLVMNVSCAAQNFPRDTVNFKVYDNILYYFCKEIECRWFTKISNHPQLHQLSFTEEKLQNKIQVLCGQSEMLSKINVDALSELKKVFDDVQTEKADTLLLKFLWAKCPQVASSLQIVKDWKKVNNLPVTENPIESIRLFLSLALKASHSGYFSGNKFYYLDKEYLGTQEMSVDYIQNDQKELFSDQNDSVTNTCNQLLLLSRKLEMYKSDNVSNETMKHWFQANQTKMGGLLDQIRGVECQEMEALNQEPDYIFTENDFLMGQLYSNKANKDKFLKNPNKTALSHRLHLDYQMLQQKGQKISDKDVLMAHAGLSVGQIFKDIMYGTFPRFLSILQYLKSSNSISANLLDAAVTTWTMPLVLEGQIDVASFSARLRLCTSVVTILMHQLGAAVLSNHLSPTEMFVNTDTSINDDIAQIPTAKTQKLRLFVDTIPLHFSLLKSFELCQRGQPLCAYMVNNYARGMNLFSGENVVEIKEGKRFLHNIDDRFAEENLDPCLNQQELFKSKIAEFLQHFEYDLDNPIPTTQEVQEFRNLPPKTKAINLHEYMMLHEFPKEKSGITTDNMSQQKLENIHPKSSKVRLTLLQYFGMLYRFRLQVKYKWVLSDDKSDAQTICLWLFIINSNHILKKLQESLVPVTQITLQFRIAFFKKNIQAMMDRLFPKMLDLVNTFQSDVEITEIQAFEQDRKSDPRMPLNNDYVLATQGLGSYLGRDDTSIRKRVAHGIKMAARKEELEARITQLRRKPLVPVIEQTSSQTHSHHSADPAQTAQQAAINKFEELKSFCELYGYPNAILDKVVEDQLNVNEDEEIETQLKRHQASNSVRKHWLYVFKCLAKVFDFKDDAVFDAIYNQYKVQFADDDDYY